MIQLSSPRIDVSLQFGNTHLSNTQPHRQLNDGEVSTRPAKDNRLDPFGLRDAHRRDFLRKIFSMLGAKGAPISFGLPDFRERLKAAVRDAFKDRERYVLTQDALDFAERHGIPLKELEGRQTRDPRRLSRGPIGRNDIMGYREE